ncbi:transporter substrate-binding domain-containing protein [Microbispora sp. RL4-1S]|uniref:Transporter substrate-binding domain-containing protein n=1 Tax=Microbispora oryzae TaxID=2806554 RepID=A0A940WFV9_9ACTN|nr:serine/threonine-protein kinase [Microbispora oryzae]MBP2704765.1 transporter substrate-binding domain-containing protein [Microbispora oryzae]
MPQISPLRPGDPPRLGPFVLSGRIGEGGQGVVYLGLGEEGEQAAVKLLHVKFGGDAIARSRFARELRAAQRVAGFCTARVLAADLQGDTPYIASEYIEGPSLRETVDASGPLTGSALERLAVGTATALTAIHRAGIVHRDFKPDNVLIAPDGPRVVDFGIARILDSTATITSRAIGTPAYMAPEQISGGDAGPPADVFSWASTIAFAATGTAVFGGDSIAFVLNRILNHEIDVSVLPEPLRGVVRDCLSKDPAARPVAERILLRLLGGGAEGGDAETTALTRGAARAAGPEPEASPEPSEPSERPAGKPPGEPSGDQSTGAAERPDAGPTGAVRLRRPRGRRRRWFALTKARVTVTVAAVAAAAAGLAALVNLVPETRAGVLQTGGAGGSGGVAAAAGASFSTVAEKAARTHRLTIGVRGDLPGVALASQGGFTGFDIDVAKYVAAKLGVPQSGVAFRPIGIGDRVRSLAGGDVDMVVGTYSYDDNKADRVTFAGPYYRAHTDVLTLANGAIHSLGDLAGRRLCAPPGNRSARLLQDKVKARPVAVPDYSVCMAKLIRGEVDAVPGDDLILAGFADREALRMSVLGLKLADQRYAIGLPGGDVKTCEAVDRAISQMYQDGTIDRLSARHFGHVDFTPERDRPAALPCR